VVCGALTTARLVSTTEENQKWRRHAGGMATTLIERPSSRRPLPRVREPLWLRPRGVQAVIILGAAAVLMLWWQDTVIVSGLGDWLTNAGRITGLLAGYGVVVLLMLMSRAPFLEHGVGTDRLARWHSAGGRYVVSLVVAHAVLITWGYAVTAHVGVVSQAGSLLRSYPDVLMATVAGGLLVGVGAVSARAARARLRYETWYLLHFYTYLAVALAFSHQFSTGADFMTHPLARIVWSAMYLAVAGLLIGYRVVMPVRASVRHRLRVVAVAPHGSDVVSITLRGRHLEELRAQPGQFFRWRFLTAGGWWQSHPFSLSAAPHHEYLRITVKDLGDHSRELQQLRVGTRALLEGPYGSFTPSRRRRRRVLLLAGGVGITPIRALFEVLASPDVTLIVRANTERELLFRSELDEIAARTGATVHYLVGPPGSEADPLVGQRLRTVTPDVARRDVYLCGPTAFMTVAQDRLRAVGVPGRHVHAEQFTF
jgi:predicted ferric reductase